PKTARIAYATQDGMFLKPIDGEEARLANLIDLTSASRPERDYVTEIVWSSDGRYLAWRQQLMDDPGYEDMLRKTRLTTLTILDTETGARQSWSDNGVPAADAISGFSGGTLASFADGHLLLFDLGKSSVRDVSVPGGDNMTLIGGMDDGWL